MNKESRIKNKQKRHTSYSLLPTSSEAGFTLIETLIYAALVSVIIGMIVVVAFQVIAGNNNLVDKIFLEEEANFIMRKIEWAISGVSTINSPASGQYSSSTLSIDKFGLPESETPVVFTVSNGELTITRGSSSSTILNSSFVTVENATFTHIAATSSAPAGIMAEFSIRNTASPKTRKYSLTTYLRQ